MTLMEFSMVPLDKGASFSAYVARILDIIDESGLDYQLTAMGTLVEGDWEDLLNLMTRCLRELQKDSDRVSVSAKFDYRKDKSGRLAGKVRSVEEKARRALKTS